MHTGHSKLGNLALVGAVAAGLASMGASHEPGLHRGEAGDVRYVHGGVGKASMKAMRELGPRFDLEVVFTDSAERYLSNVDVTLTNLETGKDVDISTRGPVLLAKLPRGRYRMMARVPDRSPARRTFELTSAGERAAFMIQLPES